MEPETLRTDGNKKFSELRTVTPLSKYLAMILFILLPFLGGWIGYVYAPEKIVEVEKEKSIVKDTPITSSVEGKTSSSNQMIDKDVDSDVTSYRGYYATRTQEIGGELRTCHAFTIFSPFDDTFDSLFERAREASSTSFGLGRNGNLVVNLPWDTISAIDKEIILGSSFENVISMRLSKQSENETKTEICPSPFEYHGLDINFWKDFPVTYLDPSIGPGGADDLAFPVNRIPWGSIAGTIKGLSEENGMLYIGFDDVEFYTQGGSCSGLNGYCRINETEEVVRLELAKNARLTKTIGSGSDNPCENLINVGDPDITKDALDVETVCSGTITPKTTFATYQNYWLVISDKGTVQHILEQYVP